MKRRIADFQLGKIIGVMPVVAVSLLSSFAACGGNLTKSGLDEAAQGEQEMSPAKRFIKLIDSSEQHLIDAVFGDVTEKDVNRLALGPIRKDLLKLQNLADVYSGRYPEVIEIRKHSKALEDAIGQYREINEKLNFIVANNGSTGEVKTWEKKLQAEAEDLARFIKKEGWNPGDGIDRLNGFRRILSKVDWESSLADANFLYSSLCESTAVVDSDPWDMFADLEDRYGLHRLKKDLRWQRLQTEVLKDDVIEVVDNGCNRDTELSLIDLERSQGGVSNICLSASLQATDFSSINGFRRCPISKCYVDELENFYELLSEAKDEGEGLTAIGRDLSTERRAQVQERLQKIRDRGTLRKVSYELQSCLERMGLSRD